MFKSLCFALVSLVFATICSADPVTITSSSYTVTGFANLPSMPTSYSLTDNSPVSSSTSATDPTGVLGYASAESGAGSFAGTFNLGATGASTGQGFAGATASALFTFQAPSDLLVVNTFFSYRALDGSSVSGSYTLTDLNTSATVGTRTFQSPFLGGIGTRSATDDFLIDHTHAYSLSMSLNAQNLGEQFDGGSFSLALNPPVAPLPSALPMGLALAALIAVASAFAGRAKGRAKVS